MKILHVLNISIPDMAGYTSRAYYLVNGQKKLGVEPVVLASERQVSKSDTFIDTFDGIRYYRTVRNNGLIRKIPFLAQINEINDLGKQVAKVCRKEKIDIVHAHSPSLVGAACLDFCRRNKIPLVYEIRAFWEDAAVDSGAVVEGSLNYKLRRHHETKVVRCADTVITICSGLKNDLLNRNIPADKIHIVPNGVDHELFKPLETDVKLKEALGMSGKTIIGFIGSFFNFEGLQDLIRAMPLIILKNVNTILLLVGKGQVDKELRELAISLNLEKNVVFVGQIPHDQVSNYYSIIDVLVYPRISKRITELVTPLKPLEAMSMAKSTLMSDVGGLRELVDAENVAVFFRAGDVTDLANKCISLCNEPERRDSIGKNARANVIAGWGWDERAKSDISIYHKLLS